MAALKNTFLVCVILLFAGCTLAVSETRVTLPGGKVFKAEIADSQKERATGLMKHEKLPEDRAMLFVFEKPGFHSFWMKNMNFPVDIIWMDGGFEIVFFVENAKPCKESPCRNYSPMKKARYVLEVPAGTVSEENLKTGDQLKCDIQP